MTLLVNFWYFLVFSFFLRFPKNINIFKNIVFLNDADLLLVRMLYHTYRLRIRNVGLLNGQNSVFSVFRYEKSDKLKIVQTVDHPLMFLIQIHFLSTSWLYQVWLKLDWRNCLLELIIIQCIMFILLWEC